MIKIYVYIGSSKYKGCVDVVVEGLQHLALMMAPLTVIQSIGLPKYRDFIKLVRWARSWPPRYHCSPALGIWHLPAVSLVTSLPNMNNDTLSSLKGMRVQHLPEHEMTEAEVKHIVLNPTPDVDEPLRMKRKFALLISFSGQGYYGMQKNQYSRTIESDLLAAMLAAGLITEEELNVPQLFSFQRGSRTDKGVSAARLLVSALFPTDVPDLVGEINKHLCDQIRVMAAYRVIKSFSSKLWCDSRTYSYMCPTFAFAPCTEVISEDYRITPEVIEELGRLLQMYIGHRNFHNFTSKVNYHELRASRRVIDANCSEPYERGGLEWITIKIRGQSFLLHQIRKMIALTMVICRGLAKPDLILRAFKEDFIDLPIAPALGLVLEDQHFDHYNKKYASYGTREPLNWDAVAENIHQFREQHVESTIVTTEIKEKSMLKWLVVPHFHDLDMWAVSPQADSQQGKTHSRMMVVAEGLAVVRLAPAVERSIV
ncbi:tRNA pseudouridine synthase A-like isoform X2 [Homarus americanus]|uniref:tRNA pseudouridine synthase A-like isoform X2 n=1 Tax=Homarus americanus TaxID=6706 RepID=UPI001C43A3B2|nr:tRNA pseudouridine synthase A-like isoform X2 [Homarus americanus]